MKFTELTPKYVRPYPYFTKHCLTELVVLAISDGKNAQCFTGIVVQQGDNFKVNETKDSWAHSAFNKIHGTLEL